MVTSKHHHFIQAIGTLVLACSTFSFADGGSTMSPQALSAALQNATVIPRSCQYSFKYNGGNLDVEMTEMNYDSGEFDGSSASITIDHDGQIQLIGDGKQTYAYVENLDPKIQSSREFLEVEFHGSIVWSMSIHEQYSTVTDAGTVWTGDTILAACI